MEYEEPPTEEECEIVSAIIRANGLSCVKDALEEWKDYLHIMRHAEIEGEDGVYRRDEIAVVRLIENEFRQKFEFAQEAQRVKDHQGNLKECLFNTRDLPPEERRLALSIMIVVLQREGRLNTNELEDYIGPVRRQDSNTLNALVGILFSSEQISETEIESYCENIGTHPNNERKRNE